MKLTGFGVIAALALPAIALTAASLLFAVPTALAADPTPPDTLTCVVAAADRSAAGDPLPCPSRRPAQAGQGATRAGYCSVAGNSLNSKPLAPGTFVNLVIGQNETDADFAGAQIAIFVEGSGATCDVPPAGFAFDGSTFVDGEGQATESENAVYPLFTKS